MIRNLTIKNESEFFKTATVGEVFTYSQSFMSQEIQKLSAENGVITKYCVPGTSEYRNNGSYTMAVISKDYKENEDMRSGLRQELIDEMIDECKQQIKNRESKRNEYAGDQTKLLHLIIKLNIMNS